jgi:hypothetical protein
LCDEFFQLHAAGKWVCEGIPVSSTNKPDHRYITEISLKVALKHTQHLPNPDTRLDYIQSMQIFVNAVKYVSIFVRLLIKYCQGSSWSYGMA